ncbi:MAG: hypothetical protein P1U89_16275 [Verrucomicrobiales bacterium]|nr:hypothetical protein [Verrucomicrobiales bacterium]
MNQNHLLIVPPEIATLASELLQFQWFLDEESVQECCDLISLSPSDDLTILLEDLKERITAIDLKLTEISKPDLFAKVETIQQLIEQLKECETILKKLQTSLHKHNSSRQAINDATALAQDYAYFRKELTKWLNGDKLEGAVQEAPVTEEFTNAKPLRDPG